MPYVTSILYDVVRPTYDIVGWQESRCKWPFAICAVFKITQSTNREMRASLPRGGRRPTPGSLVLQACNSVNLVIQACDSPVESENSHFFKCLFTKMAFCVVGGWESAQELAGSQLMLKNAWICFSTSFSFVCSNPSLQIRSICGNRGKCNQQCYPTDGLFCSVLMRQDLRAADSS